MKTMRLIGMALVALLLGAGLCAYSGDVNDFTSNGGNGNGNKNECTSTSSQSSSSTNVAAPTRYINGHEYVDLGLSVKWATCNVGASSPSGYGNYYAWGETSTKSEYTEANSKTYGKSIGNIAGNSQYDAARANWGGTWRLPTAREIDELVNRCTWKWTQQGGHNGYKITGPNGNSIFLPAAGWRLGKKIYFVEPDGTVEEEDGLYFEEKEGRYWSATPKEGDATSAAALLCDDEEFDREWLTRGECGLSVRPVSE